MKDVMERCGAIVRTVEAPWGEIISSWNNWMRRTRRGNHPKVKLVGLVHAETSTGAHQPLEGFADAVHAQGALLAIDSGDQPGQVTNCAWTIGASTPFTAARRSA